MEIEEVKILSNLLNSYEQAIKELEFIKNGEFYNFSIIIGLNKIENCFDTLSKRQILDFMIEKAENKVKELRNQIENYNKI